MPGLTVPAPKPTILQSGEQENQLVQGYKAESDALPARIEPIKQQMGQIESDMGAVTQSMPRPPVLQPIPDYKPREAEPGEMMAFATAATLFAALGARAVKTDITGALGAAGAAMKGFSEGNIAQTKVNIANFNNAIQSAMAKNQAMLQEYTAVLEDRKLTLAQKMQQYGVLAHKYQDEIAMSSMRKGDIRFELDRLDKLRAAANSTEVALAKMQANFDARMQVAEARWMAQRSRTQIVERPDGAYLVDLETGAARPVTAPGGAPLAPKSPTEKAMPASAAQKLLENQQNLRRAERALQLAQGQTVDSSVGDKAATGYKGYLPEAVLQRVDPTGVDTRAAIGDLGSLVIHDRSGAAVTAAEFPRLRPFIPQVTDDPAVVEKKLQRFVDVYRSVVQDTQDFYRESGYKVPEMKPTGGGDAAMRSRVIAAGIPYEPEKYDYRVNEQGQVQRRARAAGR